MLVMALTTKEFQNLLLLLFEVLLEYFVSATFEPPWRVGGATFIRESGTRVLAEGRRMGRFLKFWNVRPKRSAIDD